MPAPLPPSEQERIRAQRILWLCAGGLIVFNLALIFWMFLRR
jgi:hypothetical protein